MTKLFPIVNNRPTSAPVTHCFVTFSDAMRFASGGKLQLPAAATRVSVEQAQSSDMVGGPLASATTTPLLSIEYKALNRGLGSYTFIGSSGNGCNNNVTYGFPGMPSGWNDVIESSQGYSNCDVTHYENSNYNRNVNGSEITCRQYCASLYSMYDKTSSIVERPHGSRN